jgi:hypothetical protein
MFLRVEPGAGLVQQEQPRPAGQRPAHLDQALLAVGQERGEPVRAAFEPEPREDLPGALSEPLLLFPHPPRAERAARPAGPAAPVAAHEDVLEHRHVAEEPDELEGARDAARGDRVRPPQRQGLALEEDASSRRLDHARDHVEDGRLPGAVGPDQRLDLPGLDGEVHGANGREAAELLAEPLDVEESAPAHAALRARPARPPGRRIMKVMRTSPKTTISYSAAA